jgi:hypothetical protein
MGSLCRMNVHTVCAWLVFVRWWISECCVCACTCASWRCVRFVYTHACCGAIHNGTSYYMTFHRSTHQCTQTWQHSQLAQTQTRTQYSLFHHRSNTNQATLGNTFILHSEPTTIPPSCAQNNSSCHQFLRVSRYSSVGITTGYGLDGPGIECQRGEIFRTRPDRPWGPPMLLYNRYRVYFLGIKRPGRGVEHPPHISPRLKQE